MSHRQRPRLSRSGQVLPAAVFTLALGLAAPAAAETYAEANASVAGGATDNALAAPAGNNADQGADQFMVVRVGGRVFRVARSVQNDLAYVFSTTRYRDHDKANGQSHGLTWITSIALSRPTLLSLALSATYSRANSSNPLAAYGIGNGGMGVSTSGGPVVVSTGSGPVSYIGVNLAETLTHRPKASQLLVQSLGLATFLPTDSGQTPGIAANNELRGEMTRGNDTGLGAFTLGLTWTPGAEDSLGQTIVPTSRFLFGQVLAGVRHELSAAWNISGEAGGLFAMRVEQGPIVVGPAWRAAIGYHREFGQAGLEVSRSPQPNVFLGTAVIADRVRLSAALPLDQRDRFFLGGYSSYQRSRSVSSPTLSGPFGKGLEVIAASVALGYRPTDVPFAASVDYSFFDQKGGDAGNGFVVPAMRRQSVLLTLTGILRDSRPRQAPVPE